MGKLKSHSGAKKRIKRTGSGKLKAKKIGRKHKLSHKGRSRMRRLEAGLVLTPSDQRKVRTLLPYA